jgi:23S rRNA (uracil1939-C5)-methyltransferase
MPEIINELDITALVHGGRGLGRHSGKAVFVPLTVPGDRVVCRVVSAKRRFIEAELVKIQVPSPLRRQPPCPYFGTCGGCQWQHIHYPEQARWKEQIYSDLLVRSKLAVVDRIRKIVAAPHEWGYRNRVQLKCHSTATGLVLGFYRHGSHFVVDVDVCRLVSAQIQGVLELLRSELPKAPSTDGIPQVDVACGDDDQVRIILHALPKDRQPLRAWLHDFASNHDINACIQSGRKETLEVVHGDGDLRVTFDHPVMTLRYGPGGFVQVNSAQNRDMIATMLDLLALKGTEHVLDLFCGMGNFSLPLARHAARVIGVEDYAPSIASARINASTNNIHNVEFHAAEATLFLPRLHAGEIDLVVLDPPRTGCYQVACELLKLRPQRILYVSCDPATMARDLAPLVHGGYEVITGQPFDLFPQTWHIESMTLLKRADDW